LFLAFIFLCFLRQVGGLRLLAALAGEPGVRHVAISLDGGKKAFDKDAEMNCPAAATRASRKK
jgi:hypothetical protein